MENKRKSRYSKCYDIYTDKNHTQFHKLVQRFHSQVLLRKTFLSFPKILLDWVHLTPYFHSIITTMSSLMYIYTLKQSHMEKVSLKSSNSTFTVSSHRRQWHSLLSSQPFLVVQSVDNLYIIKLANQYFLKKLSSTSKISGGCYLCRDQGQGNHPALLQHGVWWTFSAVVSKKLAVLARQWYTWDRARHYLPTTEVQGPNSRQNPVFFLCCWTMTSSLP